MFILQDVPQGKPGYRRLFGIATCQIAMVVVVVEVGVREGGVVALLDSRLVYVCDC